MTQEYAVLLPGDEAGWEQATAEEREAVYAVHREFMQTLAERGHTMMGGAELTSSRDAQVVRKSPDGVMVTDGPYAETVEQLTGFYLVRTDDVDDLLDICGLLARAGGAGELRATVSGPDAQEQA